jgi:hypothetical protein
LRLNVCEKGIRGPASKYHDLVDWVVMEEERQSSTGVKGVSPNVCKVEAGGFLVAKIATGVPEEMEEICTGI